MGIPTEAGLPHAMGNAFRNVAALVADIDFTFKEAGAVAPRCAMRGGTWGGPGGADKHPRNVTKLKVVL